MPNDHPRCKSSHNVLKKGGKYTVTVKVFEEFGFRNDDPASPREKCHNYPGSLKIEDSISDRQSECHPNNPRGTSSCSRPLIKSPPGCTLSNCAASEAKISILVGQPNYVDVANNFSRPFIITVEGTVVQSIQKATVTGHEAIGDKFSMKLPNFIPTLIVRDPPGDASYAFYDKTTTSSTSISASRENEKGESKDIMVGFGRSYALEKCVGVGVSVCEEMFSIEASTINTENYENSRSTGNSNNYYVENSILETFSTSAYKTNPGPPATAFLVPTMSMVFSMAKIVAFDSQTCNASVRNDAGKL